MGFTTAPIKREFFFHPGDGAGHIYNDIVLSVVAKLPKEAYKKIKKQHNNYAAFYLFGSVYQG